jgi:hypothetical protein
MKKNVLFLYFAFVLISCEKKEYDFRDNLIGDYNVTIKGESYINDNGVAIDYNKHDTILQFKIRKSTDKNSIILKVYRILQSDTLLDLTYSKISTNFIYINGFEHSYINLKNDSVYVNSQFIYIKKPGYNYQTRYEGVGTKIK